MARTAGILLVFLASATIALGSPPCCLVSTGCCGARAAAKAEEGKRDCCSRGEREERPAPQPAKKDCACTHDVATSAAEHAPLAAILDVPAVALPGWSAAFARTPACHASPHSPAPHSHPLLL